MSMPMPIDDSPFGDDPFDTLADCAACGAEFVERRWGGAFAPSAHCSPDCDPNYSDDIYLGEFS